MNGSDINPDVAEKFKPGPAPYEGQAPAKEHEDVRRLMLEFLPPGRFLDQIHLTECATGEHGGPNDPWRRLLLMKRGAAVSQQLMLTPYELEALAARVGAEKR